MLNTILPQPLSPAQKGAPLAHRLPPLRVISTKYEHCKNPFPAEFNGDTRDQTERLRALAENAVPVRDIKALRQRVSFVLCQYLCTYMCLFLSFGTRLSLDHVLIQ